MKKIDNRDLINMQTTQDLIQRYDFSVLDRMDDIKEAQQESEQISFRGMSFE